MLTRIEEISSIDVSKIVTELDANQAEVMVLKEALLRKDDELLVCLQHFLISQQIPGISPTLTQC